jgi:hypothetical protein
MTRHRASPSDVEFRRAFEAGEIAPGDFGHVAHVRLAYIFLCENSADDAAAKMKDALLGFLQHNGIPETKYHETLTRAWILAVKHFMDRSTGDRASADAFIESSPQLLDSKIMLTHYSAEVLFSADARQSFVEPDIQSIPPR